MKARPSGRPSKGEGGAEKEKRERASPRLPKKELAQRVALAFASGVLMFTGFAGFDLWPFALVAFVPVLFALDRATPISWRAALGLGTVYGFTTAFGGYYWLVGMLERFSGFPLLICLLLASILILYTAGVFILFSWLFVRGVARGWSPTLVAVSAYLTGEFVWPLLFPYCYGASFHALPLLLQVADLGGGLLVSALPVAISGAIFEVVRAMRARAPIPRLGPLTGLAFVVFVLAYGAYRIDEVDGRIARARKIDVGLVQANMGIFEKRRDAEEGQRRHIEQSLALEATKKPDLIVWPESAFAGWIPDAATNVRRAVMREVSSPVLFGGLSFELNGDSEKHFNRAFLVDGTGDVLGTYDKTYLLAFGEYLPFGDVFPILYEWSPNTGHFTPGSHVRVMKLGDIRISTLICYEDILPAFVRRAVREGDPHFLVNITNDAWFGDTTEPWIHFALSQLRSVEHHRFLVRATNSGVSGVVDAAGRVITQSKVFTRETLRADVALLEDTTVYEVVGDWPGWLALAAAVFFAWRRRT